MRTGSGIVLEVADNVFELAAARKWNSYFEQAHKDREREQRYALQDWTWGQLRKRHAQALREHGGHFMRVTSYYGEPLPPDLQSWPVAFVNEQHPAFR